MKAKKVQNLSVFFQPIEGKKYWGNCAEIIISKKNSELQERYIYKMLLWIQDMNWPGAEKIYDRMLLFPLSVIEYYLRFCLLQAEKLNDKTWYNNLSSLLNELISR